MRPRRTPTQEWQGVFAPAATLFRADQSLDLDATARHFRRLVQAGVDGLVVLGTSGENTVLEAAEKEQVIELAVRTVRGAVPVLAGVAESTTAAACRSAAAAARLGADGLMVLPALVYRADAGETLAHFRAVANATPLPILAYNNPGTYGVDITPEMFVELARQPTLVAIKESSGDGTRFTDIISRLGARYRLFCGADGLAFESGLLGACGWISGFHNVFPRESLQFWRLVARGNYERAAAFNRWFMPLFHLDVSPKLVQYIKLGMAELGYGRETVRAPRLPLRGRERQTVLSVFRRLAASRPAGR